MFLFCVFSIIFLQICCFIFENDEELLKILYLLIISFSCLTIFVGIISGNFIAILWLFITYLYINNYSKL